MKTYSKSEMLAIWRRRLGLETTRADATIAAFEGINTDALIAERMRLWYLNLLQTANPAWLPTADVANSADLQPYGLTSYLIKLPDGACRPLRVKMHGWDVPATPVGPDAAPRLLARMASPFGLPSANRPLAAITDCGIVVAPVEMPLLESLIAVVDPGPDKYTLEEHLLDTINLTLNDLLS